MQKARIKIVQEGTWGKATIFAESEVAIQSETKIKENDSKAIVNAPDSAAQVQSEHDKVIEEITEHLEIDLGQLVSTADIPGLPYFSSALFATVLEDAITQFRILDECNNELRVTKALCEYSLLRALKYNVEQEVNGDELQGINPYDLNKLEYKLKKLNADRIYMADLLVKLYVGLTTQGSFQELCDAIEAIIDKERRYYQLIEDEAKNKILSRELARQLRQQRNHHKAIEYDSNVLIDNLRSEIEDADLLTETQGRYVDNWQAARTEQHGFIIQTVERGLTSSTDFYKQRTDHEQRVHSEVELLTNILINVVTFLIAKVCGKKKVKRKETLEKIEQWMAKYEKDMEDIDLKIQIKRLEWQNMYDKRVYLEKKFYKHDLEMKNWIQFKLERAKAREYADNMHKFAIVVQAWWRGLLVRKELGPFRVKKKKKAPKQKWEM